MSVIRSVCVGLAFASAALAQFPIVLPAGNDLVFAGNNGTGVGYAANKGISQNLYIPPFTVGSISAVGFRRTATSTDFAAQTIDFEITLSSTTADLATLSATFANNLGADQTVTFPRTLVSIPAAAANSSPSDFVVMPGQAPWLFGLGGPNLLIQCKSYGPGTNVNAWRMDRCFERTTAGEAVTWGRSCSTATISSSSTAPAYMPGSTLTFALASAPTLQPAFATFGFDQTNASGLPLPADLTIFGMPGCTLLNSLDAVLPTATDGAGAASVQLTIPGNAGLAGLGFGMQWIHGDPNAGNALGLVTTAGRVFHIGALICANRYVYSLSNEAALTGTLQAGGPVVKLF